MRRAVAPTMLLVVVLSIAPAAAAKSYSLPESSVDVHIDRHGTVFVTEHITFDYSGDFSGAFRDIPLRPGESLSDVSVSENGRSYEPGASAELGSEGRPGTFGTAPIAGAVRIVWHYRAADERRSFDISYTLHGFVDAYDDIVDFKLKVWGDEWTVPLDRLTADVTLPGRARGEVRVWGHPGTVTGSTELDPSGRGASLEASGIDAGQAVEIRVTFPRSMLGGSIDGPVIPGPGLPSVLDQEKKLAQQDAIANARAARDRARVQWVLDHLWALVLAGLLAAIVPAALISYFIWVRYGREPSVPEPPLHLHEPPGDEAPAMIAALLDPSGRRATGDAFAATLFDLIRRGHVDAIPTTTSVQTWGGLRSEDVSDLAIQVKERSRDDLRSFENEVLEAVSFASKDHGDGTQRLHLTELKDEIQADPAHFSEVFGTFKKQVLEEVGKRAWWMPAGLKVAGSACALAWVGTVASIFAAWISFDTSGGFPWASVGWGLGAALFGANAVALTIFLVFRRGWERRSREGAEAASRWAAFRRFLTDFAGMKEAVPGSIAIWEQYLCYGIAFGVAERVLAAAQLHAPPELRAGSSVFFIDSHGYLGAGLSAAVISDISHAMQTAAPPSSSGGGGGFSGGGGGFSGGGGGGGGGAW